MPSEIRHQCLIYKGAPSNQLPALAAVTRQKLSDNYRCLYLNSPHMVAGMRSCLAAAGVDVAEEAAKGSLVVSSERPHLLTGNFDVDLMLCKLEDSLELALRDGYAGLWATGDMTWELGGQASFARLLEYEWRLEDVFRKHPGICGICQYQADTLPREMLRVGAASHGAMFVNETLGLLNPHHLRTELVSDVAAMHPELDAIIDRLCQAGA